VAVGKFPAVGGTAAIRLVPGITIETVASSPIDGVRTS
jgi:hypothetical protein